MAKISEYTIEQVRSHADIVDVVSDFVDLKKKGRNFFGLCPFHNEKTPSFSVSQEKQIYHCFGCGAGGGSIHFIMAIEKLEFIEAIRYLADKFAIPVKFDRQSGSRQIITQLEEIHRIATQHFQENLSGDNGKTVLKHLKSRGLNSATIDKFQIGFSLPGWQTLLDRIRNEGFSPEAMVQCGLFIQSDKGFFDRFRSRIMFPIHNRTGVVVAFAGRVFNSDDPAKYVNSPETPLYHKSRILYGLWAVKQLLRDHESIIIVEGYLDFLQLYQAGISNAVAVSGTAFTDDHARELMKYTQKVKLAYDGDKAGRKAAIRAGYLLLRNDLEPGVIRIPDGMDPDDWVKSKGPEPFRQAADNAMGLIEFHASQNPGSLNDPVKKTRFAREVLQEIVQISDEITQQVYIQHLSSINQIPENALYKFVDQLHKTRKQRGKAIQVKDPSVTTTVDANSSYQPLEDEVILLCMSKDEQIRKMIVDHLDLSWFRSEMSKSMAGELLEQLNHNMTPEPAGIMDHLTAENLRRKFSSLLYQMDEFSPSLQLARDCLIRLEDRHLKQKLNLLRTELKAAETKQENIIDLLMEIQEIGKLRKSLQGKYLD